MCRPTAGGADPLSGSRNTRSQPAVALGCPLQPGVAVPQPPGDQSRGELRKRQRLGIEGRPRRQDSGRLDVMHLAAQLMDDPAQPRVQVGIGAGIRVGPRCRQVVDVATVLPAVVCGQVPDHAQPEGAIAAGAGDGPQQAVLGEVAQVTDVLVLHGILVDRPGAEKFI